MAFCPGGERRWSAKLKAHIPVAHPSPGHVLRLPDSLEAAHQTEGTPECVNSFEAGDGRWGVWRW